MCLRGATPTSHAHFDSQRICACVHLQAPPLGCLPQFYHRREGSKRVVCVQTETMQIKDLPFGVIFQLCRQLDSSHAGRFSWRALLSHVPSTSNSQSSTLYFSLSLSLPQILRTMLSTWAPSSEWVTSRTGARRRPFCRIS